MTESRSVSWASIFSCCTAVASSSLRLYPAEYYPRVIGLLGVVESTGARGDGCGRIWFHGGDKRVRLWLGVAWSILEDVLAPPLGEEEEEMCRL